MSGSSLKSFAPSFYQDLNGDGVIGRAINGGVTLEADLARRHSTPARYYRQRSRSIEEGIKNNLAAVCEINQGVFEHASRFHRRMILSTTPRVRSKRGGGVSPQIGAMECGGCCRSWRSWIAMNNEPRATRPGAPQIAKLSQDPNP
jgi:hypothetical protein